METPVKTQKKFHLVSSKEEEKISLRKENSIAPKAKIPDDFL
jgi:hypothetical protein